jgi:hypothetical protein
MSRRRKGWKARGNYAWRTKKPHAPLGLSSRWLALAGLVLGAVLYIGGGWWWLAPLVMLFSGRHWAYVGQTSSRYHRDRQHRGLDPRVPPSPWSDLDAKAYPLPSLPWWRWSRELSEWFWTIVLLPVYPVPKQAPWNLRKISKAKAQRQRAARDMRRQKSPVRTLAVDILVTSVRLILGLAMVAGTGYYAIMR